MFLFIVIVVFLNVGDVGKPAVKNNKATRKKIVKKTLQEGETVKTEIVEETEIVEDKKFSSNENFNDLLAKVDAIKEDVNVDNDTNSSSSGFSSSISSISSSNFIGNVDRNVLSNRKSDNKRRDKEENKQMFFRRKDNKSKGNVTEIFGINISGGFFGSVYSSCVAPLNYLAYAGGAHENFGIPLLKDFGFVSRADITKFSTSVICFTYKRFKKIDESWSYLFNIDSGLWGSQQFDVLQTSTLNCLVLFGINREWNSFSDWYSRRVNKSVKRIESSITLGPNVFFSVTNFVSKNILNNLIRPYDDWVKLDTCLTCFADVAIKIALLRLVYDTGKSFEVGFTITNFITYSGSKTALGYSPLTFRNPFKSGIWNLLQIYMDFGLKTNIVD